MSLIDRLTFFTVDKVLGDKPDPSFNTDKPELTIKITTPAGKDFTYSFSKPADKRYYVFKESNKPYFMTASESSVKGFKETSGASLMKFYDDELKADAARKKYAEEQAKKQSAKSSAAPTKP